MSRRTRLTDLRRALAALPRRPAEAKRLASLVAALADEGWSRSARAGAAVDAGGRPLAWYTMPALEFLGPRLPGDARVLEFGCGNSTAWYAARVASVVAVEHDAAWAARVGADLPRNASLVVHDVSALGTAGYLATLEDEPPGSFDIIAVDGLERVRAASLAFDRVARGGLVVVDNADRPALRPILDDAAQRRLQRIDFVGPVPGSGRLSTTTVFGADLEPWLRQAPPLPFRGYEGVTS